MKLLRDAFVLARLDSIRHGRPLYAFIAGMFLLPLPMLFFVHYALPDSDDIGPRLVAGSVVLGIGLRTVSEMGMQLNQDRFTYRMKLIRSCPIHPFAYGLGMIISGTGRAVLNALVVLLFAPVFGIDISLSIWFLPVVILASVSLSGVALIIGTWSPTFEVGVFISNLAGTFITLISPVYFPVSRLPDWAEPIAHLSPYTHAAEALDAMLSGRGGFLDEITILAAISVVGVAIGMLGMRWREN